MAREISEELEACLSVEFNVREKPISVVNTLPQKMQGEKIIDFRYKAVLKYERMRVHILKGGTIKWNLVKFQPSEISHPKRERTANDTHTTSCGI